tara:strand:+ start:820 stop:1635 length:816 start_codon:yes stop_codon:yes gene_type:complete
MKNFIYILKATFEKDYKNYSTYRFNIFGELAMNFFFVFMIFYVAISFADIESSRLERFDGNYFLFLISGVMVLLFISRILSTAVFFMGSAQSQGYLESLLATKTSLFSVLLGSIAFPYFQSLIRVSILFVFAYIFDSESINFFQIFDAVFILSISVIPFLGLSFVICGFILIYKKASFLSSFILLGCAVFSGIFFPVSVLPSFLQTLSLLFPSTASVSLMRARVIEGIPYNELYVEFFSLFIYSSIYLILGIIIMKRSIVIAKRNGSISHY